MSVLAVLTWTIQGFSAAVRAQSTGSASCEPAAVGDSQPWVHNARVLDSFPPDNPPPRFLGRFASANSQYELHIWRDSAGIFGEFLSPVLDTDSPSSRLYNVHFDPKSDALNFTARFPDPRAFDGYLRRDYVTGRIVRDGKSEAIILRRVPLESLGAALQAVTSRAQFDCQMMLFRRY
jgi:hypothetical protein